MKRMSSREAIKAIEAIGWRLNRVKGDHHIFSHPTRRGIVVVPHPKKSLPTGTLSNILKTAGVI